MSESDAESDEPTQSIGSTTELARKLVRLALACERQRRSLRRTDINERVMIGIAGKPFKRVFEQAQNDLRNIFGMELVALPAKENVTVAQKRGTQVRLLMDVPY